MLAARDFLSVVIPKVGGSVPEHQSPLALDQYKKTTYFILEPFLCGKFVT